MANQASDVAMAACPDAAADAEAAMHAAVNCGAAVEALSDRTEESRTFVNPDRTSTLEQWLRPRWARGENGRWRDADATLRWDGRGGVEPVASTVEMAFSGGGSGPLATIRDGAKELRLTWPGAALPTPVLDGSTATYAEVLPGVDLHIRADVDRFSELLVVKSRAAAKNPLVRQVRLLTTATGLRLRADAASGALSAVDADTGEPVFSGGTPMMWDSRGGDSSAVAPSTAGDAARAEPRQAPMRVRLGAGEVTLTPDTAMLDNPSTEYPVVLDPTWGKARSHWTILRRSHPSSSFYDTTSTANDDGTAGAVKAGHATDSLGTYSDRSLFQMPIDGIGGTKVISAVFSLRQLWSWQACGGSGHPTRLFELNSTFNSSTTWNTSWNKGTGTGEIGAGWGAQLGSTTVVKRHNGSGSCGPGTISFTITANAQAHVTAGHQYLWLGLKSDSDLTDLAGWRRYDLSTVFLSVNYNSYPNQPSTLKINGKACAGSPVSPDDVTLAVNGTMATVVLSDPDGDPLVGTFERQATKIIGINPMRMWGDTTVVGTANGPTAQLNLGAVPTFPPAPPIYRYRVQARDPGGLDSVWSDWCAYRVDMIAPGPPSGVSSTDYPSDDGIWGGVGQPGVFTFDPPSTTASDVAQYVWALTPLTTPPTDGSRTVAADANHIGTATITPTVEGINVLRVWTMDAAGNISNVNAPFEYIFTVGP